jgi:hypothetical protein
LAEGGIGGAIIPARDGNHDSGVLHFGSDRFQQASDSLAWAYPGAQQGPPAEVNLAIWKRESMLIFFYITSAAIAAVGLLNWLVRPLVRLPSAFIALAAHLCHRKLEERLSEDRPLTPAQADIETLDWVPTPR